MKTASPRVSVSILTYNQREVIGQAIDSVLAQQVDFPYEIIIGDDYSTDGTREVLEEYRRRHPELIHLILHPRRYEDEVPGRTNNMTNLACCRGEYTAMLDGDDYWTDPDKLQRQYDRLEANPDLVMCLHNSTIVYEGTGGRELNGSTIMEQGSIRQSGVYTHQDIAKLRLGVQIHSIMFRTRAFEYFPDWFNDVVPADNALMLLLSQRGDFYYDTRPQAVYRVTGEGFVSAYATDYELTLRRLEDVELFAREFPDTYLPVLRQKPYAYLYFRLLKRALVTGRPIVAVRHLFNVLVRDPLYPIAALRGRLAR